MCRIEDTDAARSTKESEEAVLRDLAWMGIKWDEGGAVILACSQKESICYGPTLELA